MDYWGDNERKTEPNTLAQLEELEFALSVKEGSTSFASLKKTWASRSHPSWVAGGEIGGFFWKSL